MKPLVSAFSRLRRSFGPFLLSLVVLLAGPQMLGQQVTNSSTAPASIAVQPLITQAIDENKLTVLKGNTHPLARPQYDLGAAPATLPLERMLLVLKRSPQQESALRKLLDDQHDKNSPNYHHWLTPEDFGRQFGPTDSDIQTITAWLQSHGFQVGTTKGRAILEFSGSASQVQEAFHTTIHKYLVNGEQHWANASDPQIPTALTPAVAGILTLHNFLKKPQYILSKHKGTITPGNPPQITLGGGLYALSPGDYAVIYNIAPVYSTLNVNGSGITIGVIGRSDIQLSDFTAFQQLLKFSSNTPTITVNGTDPGDVSGDDVEGTLDATWAQAIAPGANVNFVISASTDTTDGVDLSAFYIVENNLANIMTESFGGCEAFNGDAEVEGIAVLAEQAAAQGITYLASSGDAGAEGCDDPNAETVATGPISVNLPASTPFTVAVGGTSFNYSADPSKYWSASNPTGAYGAYSALSYIPENVWNDSCLASTCGSDANIAAGGGGESTGNTISGGTFPGFAKPSWQSVVTGIPNDGARDVPDVSLNADPNTAYLLCFQGSCASNEVELVGGTSASAPSFAAIMALIDQRMGQVEGTIGERQGLANYVLYPLAANENSTFATCNASSTTTLPGSACTFNDVTVGNNEVPGEAGYPSAPYDSNKGYDPASGLGSVDVYNLVKSWASATFRPTTTTLKLNNGSSVNVTHGTDVPVSITVAPSSGSGTPAGDVSLIASVGGTNGGPSSVDGFTLTNGSTVSGTTTSQLPGGTSYQVHAHYAGNSTSTSTGIFAPSDSSAVTVTVTPESSDTTITGETFSLSGNNLSVVPLGSGTGYGNLVYLHAFVQGNSGNGVPTGTVSFNDGSGPAIPGNPYPLNAGSPTNAGVSDAVTAQGLITLSPGTYAVTAAYVGDNSFKASTSSPLSFTITKAVTSGTVTPSATSITSGNSITLTANISTGTATLPSFGAAPTGTVSFYSNGTLIGSAQPVTGTAGSGSFTGGTFNPSTATAALTTTSLPTGSDTITAVYNGDANYAASSASPGVVVNVAPSTPDFSLSATPVSVSQGQMQTGTVTITAVNGFNGTISNFGCSGLPAEATCGFNPTSVTGGQGSTTVTINTAAIGQLRQHALNAQPRFGWMTGVFAVTLFPALGICLIGIPARDRKKALLAALMVIALVAVLPSCGGGGGGGGNQNNPVPSISSLSPTQQAAGSASQTLTINGTGFISSSSVTYNGVAHTATFMSASALTINLTQADLATTGNFPVVVTNPAPGGGASSAANFGVVSGTPTGSFTVTVTASSGSLTHNATFTLTVQ